MFATHLNQGRIAFRGRTIPVAALPIGTAQLGKRIESAKTDAKSIRARFNGWRLKQIVCVRDAHGSTAVMESEPLL